MKRKRDQIGKPNKLDASIVLGNYFSAEEFENLVESIPLKSAGHVDTLRHALPFVFARYLRVRSGELGAGLSERRKKLSRISRQAKKLRNLLLELDHTARLDFLTTASGLTGDTFTIDTSQPVEWLSNHVSNTIRDISVASSKSEKQLRTISIRGGRPKHIAERVLIWDLAELYHSCAGRWPGRRGYFPKFAKFIFQKLEPTQANEGLDDLIKEVIKSYKSEF